MTEEMDTDITLYSEREDKDRENIMATPAMTTTSQSPMEGTLTLLTEIVVKDREDRHAEKEAMKEIEERREHRRRQEIEETRLETLERQKELELMRMDDEKKIMDLQQDL